ncbi:MAG: VCBS repeat-containing protein [Opitutaceae bacterium]|nr:VCBS repeat-containing protein [Opitutaceae bacterium]
MTLRAIFPITHLFRSRRLPAASLLALLVTVGPVWSADLRSFDRVQLLEPKGETSASVSLGDIDGDGDLDLILAKGRHWPLDNLILRNDGKGTFTHSKLPANADRTYSAALADLDGDGSLDLVVSNDRPDKKVIYLNDGRGVFRLAGTFGRPEWSTRYITVADLNGDGRPDIVVANRSSNPEKPVPCFVCLNDGKGGFPTEIPLPTQSATIIVAADLDRDGKIDLFIPHRDGGQSLIFWNDGTGKFTAGPVPVGPKSSSVRAAGAADLDGDGIADLVVGDAKTGMFLYRGQGRRGFAEPVPLGERSGAPYSIGIADMNRDGKPDIVVGRQEARGSVFFNLGAARNFDFTEGSWGDGQGAVYGLALGDLDGDGWADVAAARSDAPNAVWFSGPARKP